MSEPTDAGRTPDPDPGDGLPRYRRFGRAGRLVQRDPATSGGGGVTTGARRHTVLATAESEAFGSLRKRPTSRSERFAIGRALRQQVPRRALGHWEAPADRPDPSS